MHPLITVITTHTTIISTLISTTIHIYSIEYFIMHTRNVGSVIMFSGVYFIQVSQKNEAQIFKILKHHELQIFQGIKKHVSETLCLG